MINTSHDLSNKLPAEQVNIIRQVVRAAESQGLRLFIVGAQARDLLLQYIYDLPRRCALRIKRRDARTIVDRDIALRCCVSEVSRRGGGD